VPHASAKSWPRRGVRPTRTGAARCRTWSRSPSPPPTRLSFCALATVSTPTTCSSRPWLTSTCSPACRSNPASSATSPVASGSPPAQRTSCAPCFAPCSSSNRAPRRASRHWRLSISCAGRHSTSAPIWPRWRSVRAAWSSSRCSAATGRRPGRVRRGAPRGPSAWATRRSAPGSPRPWMPAAPPWPPRWRRRSPTFPSAPSSTSPAAPGSMPAPSSTVTPEHERPSSSAHPWTKRRGPCYERGATTIASSSWRGTFSPAFPRGTTCTCSPTPSTTGTRTPCVASSIGASPPSPRGAGWSTMTPTSTATRPARLRLPATRSC
jgi:hypothetical protein